jgi:endonuclease/exonuclease/phosphatase family metal-dependent hydrolase
MDRLTVATYNIHQCVGMDKRHEPDRVARVILELDAQVIGLQEVSSGHRAGSLTKGEEYLAEATGFHSVPGPTMLRGDSRYGNSLFSRFPVSDVRHIDLSVPGREPRGAIDALLHIDGRAVNVVVTHLGLNRAERRDQVRRLTESLRRERARLTVVLGDTNEWLPVSRSLSFLERCLGRSPRPRTYPSRYPVLALDRIWVRPRQALSGMCVHDTLLSRTASDHLPVKAYMKLDQRIP